MGVPSAVKPFLRPAVAFRFQAIFPPQHEPLPIVTEFIDALGRRIEADFAHEIVPGPAPLEERIAPVQDEARRAGLRPDGTRG